MSSINIVRLAAAGAGKTWKICNDALFLSSSVKKSKRILLITYTNNGVNSIINELENQNCGVVPQNVIIMSWYQFLLRELIRPYQTFIANINEIRSFDYSQNHKRNFEKNGTRKRYITNNKDVRSEEASNLVLLINEKSGGLVFNRLEEIYSHIYIDEIQDLAGMDLGILCRILKSSIDVTCVGDNKQATFQTHTAKVNKKISGTNIFEFFAKKEHDGILKIEKNLCSRRFNVDICSFANCLYPNENNMTTSMKEISEHDGIYIIERNEAMRYYQYFRPQELRYSKSTGNICGNFAINFGECKGKTYDRCLIHPPKTLIDFLKGKTLKSPQKYYVAMTRAKYSNAIVIDKLFSAKGFEQCEIVMGTEKINAMKYKRKE